MLGNESIGDSSADHNTNGLKDAEEGEEAAGALSSVSIVRSSSLL